ncbi:MAG TPA: hypothetical protein PLZ08_10910 [Bacillota bacterium]|nr:hypothetical protein [Bacillota bacterium]HOL11067.1 hypothetical protein [Bacillota bacterium]HPO98447.1 hypothetical protein [Bacillota bacterium]
MQNCYKNIPLFDMRIGMIFYFFNNPNNFRSYFIEFLRDFESFTNCEFLLYRHNKEAGMNKLKMSGMDYLVKLFNETDFNQTQHLILSDGNKDNLQNHRLEMILRTIKPEYPIKSPNWIYFELPLDTDFMDVFSFMKHAFLGMTFHYACCNYILAQNDYLMPKSSAETIKRVKQSQFLNDPYSVWLNPFFVKELENGIDGVNYIQLLSKRLYQQIGFEEIINNSKTSTYYHEFGEDYVVFSLSRDSWPQAFDETLFNKYKSLYNVLKPIILEIKKPLAYWKSDEWEVWIKRFR